VFSVVGRTLSASVSGRQTVPVGAGMSPVDRRDSGQWHGCGTYLGHTALKPQTDKTRTFTSTSNHNTFIAQPERQLPFDQPTLIL